MALLKLGTAENAVGGVKYVEDGMEKFIQDEVAMNKGLKIEIY